MIDRWLSRAVLAAGLAGTALFASSTKPAAAMSATWFHVELLKSDPKANDTLATSPKAISLWFSETVQSGATSIRLTSADGKIVSVGKVTVASAAKSPAVAPLSSALKSGRYSVAWRTMADDGHPAKGSFNFVVR
jgi:methionine-rich copper-binding protein CopC